ncbi:MAG: TonB-dependent receptor [Zoogloeaceae bacterium]|nr:TonB-dependent receptor [Zoogloeaceae bacterium]
MQELPMKFTRRLMLASLCMSGTAWAQEHSEPVLFDTIVVTTSRSAEALKSVSVPVTVIDEEDIQRLNADTLPELLKHYGVQINDKGAGTGSSEVMIRGLTSNANPNESGTVLILLDGRRIGNSNIGHIPLQNIGKVEVIRGAASVQYGSEASGGVINLISKRGQEKFAFSLEQSLGSFDIRKTQVGLSGREGIFDYSLAGSSYKSGDFEVGGDKGSYHNTGTREKYLGGVSLGLNFDPNHRVALVGHLSDGEYGRSGAFTEGKPAVNPYGRANRGNQSWDLSYEGSLPEQNLSWQARYFQGETTYETASNWNTGAGYYKYSSDFKGAGLKASWNSPWIHLTGGVDYYDVDQTKTTTPPPTASYDNSAGYLIAKLPLLEDRLWLTGGIRHDTFELKSGTTHLKKDRDTGSFGVAYLPLDWLKIRANTATSFKMPEPTHISYRPGSTTYLANPDLTPETSRGWEIGTDIAYRNVNASLTWFNVDYKDKIESVALSASVRQYQNLPGTTRYRGLEASLDWSAGRALGWEADLKPYVSLTRMVEFKNSETGEKTSNVADLSLSYGVAYRDPGQGFRASLDATYYGHKYPHYTTAQIRYGGETVVNLHLAKDLYNWGEHRLILKVDIANLTDKYYETLRNYPEAGRAFLVGLRYEY